MFQVDLWACSLYAAFVKRKGWKSMKKLASFITGAFAVLAISVSGSAALSTTEPGVENLPHVEHYSSTVNSSETVAPKPEKIVQTAGRKQLGEFAPDFAHYNDDVLFGENWNNQDIDIKTRCTITVVALISSGITDSSLKYHIANAKSHGVTQKEMSAIITHTAFYVGWPKAWAAFNLAKEVYGEN
jgi:4-carboxymuconolactone decarboxylase